MDFYLSTLMHLDSLLNQIWAHLDFLKNDYRTAYIEDSAFCRDLLDPIYDYLVILQGRVIHARGELVRERMRRIIEARNDVPEAPTMLNSRPWRD
ncbi:hypothetical protein V2G26_012214 [Clonostachys chloroleuca]